MSNQDEKDAVAYVRSRAKHDGIETVLDDIRPAFLDGVKHGRKGYIKAEKAIEVVAMFLYFMESRDLVPHEFIDLPEKYRETYLDEAKKKLGIEDE